MGSATSTTSTTSPDIKKKSSPKCGFFAYFQNHSKGPGIHKWVHYFDVYEELFGHFCTSAGTRHMRMMEIGIQSGGSMMMWRHAFGDNLNQLIGVDINANTKAWEKFGSNVKVEIGSQANASFLESLTNKYRNGIDVILDDGSHLPGYTILTFVKLWPLVRAGGVYMIEDLHGPNPVYDWIYFGYRDSQINWPGIMGAESKKGPKLGLAPGNMGFFNQWQGGGAGTPSALQADVYSVNAYPYMLTIRKREKPLKVVGTEQHGTEWIPPGGG